MVRSVFLMVVTWFVGSLVIVPESTAQQGSQIVHDAEYYILEAQNGASWAAEDEALDARLAGLHETLFIESNPIPVKWAVTELGLAPRGIRLPLTWLSEGSRPRVKAAMEQAGVIG